jgi:hypothetical protein
MDDPGYDDSQKSTKVFWRVDTKIYFRKDTERKFFFILTLVMLFCGIIAKIVPFE